MPLMEPLLIVGLIAIVVVPAVLVWRALQQNDHASFEAEAERICSADVNAEGLYIGPPARLNLRRSRGLIVEPNLGRVVVDNNMWIDGCLDVRTGTHLHVTGALFYDGFGPAGLDNITAGAYRSIESPEGADKAWEEYGGLNGQGVQSS